MSDELRMKALRLLDSIGGSVAGSEVVYHLDENAYMELFDASEDGLVIARTFFELTEEGQALIASSPGVVSFSTASGEEAEVAPALRPGGAGAGSSEQRPVGFAACHGRPS